ncbi:hypothetical protein MPHL43072_02190 [Mycolicibacterium phlei DSM 43072]|nr:hypothetical protein MPHL43072_02190 [Mycolicibacterium phlei DSM 43072]
MIANASERPQRRFVLFEDGTEWSYARTLDEAAAAGNALRELGVDQGDRVALIMSNGPDFLRLWFGAALLGATIVPLNPALKDELLTRPLKIAGPSAIFTEVAELRDELRDAFPGTPVMPAREVTASDRSIPELKREIGLWDDEKLLMTSGTTGPSKLVRVPYLYGYCGYSAILIAQGFRPGDVFQIDIPLFHTAALGYVNGALATGAGIYVRSKPALDRYWEIARDADVSAGILISSMVPVLMSQPPRDADRDHRVRFLMVAPLPPDIDDFKARFGIPVLLTACGSTEASTPFRGVGEQGVDTSYCGEVVPGFEVRLVDANDQEVPVGASGEAIVRAARPFMMSPGYVGDESATARAWRNGWFHTGDLLRADEHGRYYFVDRIKDVVRRRGENISAYEVERAFYSHPSVAEVACVAHPSDTGVEDEVKVFVVKTPGGQCTPAELLEHVYERLPYHMVPRYFEFIDALPKTTTDKPQKYLLREMGNSEATWDSVANGYRVTRHGIERPQLEHS